MKYSLKIGSAWGIPIELHITFILLMIVVFALTFPEIYYFALILFLFVFVVAHELAHSIVARHYNIKVRKIVLYPIGGVSEIDEIPDNPRIEWRMAIAGPLTSFIIGTVLLVTNQLVSPQPISLTLTGDLIFDLAILNLVLGAFNLIPAFPMDGGRVFRALLAERMKFSDATRTAATIGKVFGILMVMFGILFNLWLVIIGIFIYIGAGEEAEQTIVSTAIAGVRIKDVMSQEVATVKPDTILTDALETMFKARYHDAIIEKDGELYGTVCWNDIMKIKSEQRSSLKVDQLPRKQFSAFPDESILEAYKVMAREKLHLLPVVNKETPTKVIGAVTSEAIAYAFERAKNQQ